MLRFRNMNAVCDFLKNFATKAPNSAELFIASTKPKQFSKVFSTNQRSAPVFFVINKKTSVEFPIKTKTVSKPSVPIILSTAGAMASTRKQEKSSNISTFFSRLFSPQFLSFEALVLLGLKAKLQTSSPRLRTGIFLDIYQKVLSVSPPRSRVNNSR